MRTSELSAVRWTAGAGGVGRGGWVGAGGVGWSGWVGAGGVGWGGWVSTGGVGWADWDAEETFELSVTMPANYMNNGWVYVLEEVDTGSTRLIVRWRGDYSPGLGNELSLGILTEAGALVMQPKLLKAIKARAEAAGGQQRGSSEARLWDEL